MFKNVFSGEDCLNCLSTIKMSSKMFSLKEYISNKDANEYIPGINQDSHYINQDSNENTLNFQMVSKIRLHCQVEM